MANTNKPFGLRPYGSLTGAPFNGATKTFLVPATDATAIYIGDPVKLAGTEGVINPDDIPMPTVTKAASADVVVGVVTGIVALPTDLTVLYRKASTAMYVEVAVDPNLVFSVQGDADTYAAADVGLNMDFTVSTGSATTGVSNLVADQSSANTTATLDLQVIGSLPQVGNDLTGGYPLLLVRLNNHQYIDGTTGL